LGKIAIVGMACEYPDALNTDQLWSNILSKKKSFRRIPQKRLPINEYYSKNTNEPDKIYSEYVSVIEDYIFDREKFNVSGSTFRSTDLTHWLALDVATRALEDAGYLKNVKELPKEKTGVLVGNTLTGEFSRSSIMRLRWPYVQKVINEIAVKNGWEKEVISKFLLDVEQKYKHPFPKVNEDTLAGGLSNTIAGRICNYFDLNGGGYTVDGACSSSLLAVSNGCTNLMNKQLDVALVGGVDLSLDPFELVGFSKTQALAKGEMKIFDKDSNGFWPGEGCGFVVLMREDYALKNGFKIYATIEGWGISSDGRGGITRPELKGQTLALQRAYQMADFSMNSVQYFEGHGTGTKVGDNVELLTLNNFRLNEQSTNNPAYIGSIKGNIGHTKAAAGIAGLIKAVLAISNKTIPPITGCSNPHEILIAKESSLRITDTPLPWVTNDYLRAGVSSMGFGGINVHLALQSVEKQGKTELNHVEKYLSSSFQDYELLCFTGDTIKQIQSQIYNVLEKTSEISFSELAGLSHHLYRKTSKQHIYRAAIIISNPNNLKGKLNLVIDLIEQGLDEKVDLVNGLFFGKHKVSKIGFLFPGQGAPIKEKSGIITSRFSEVEEFYNKYPENIKGSIKDTINIQPNIIKATLASIKLLNSINIDAQIGIGHSLGELAALYWAGSIKEDDIIQIAKLRGKVMAKASPTKTTMAGINASETEVRELLTANVVIACYNSDSQFVISGEEESVKAIVKDAAQKGIAAKLLPVSQGFHSKYMSNGKSEFYEYLSAIPFKSLKKSVISTVTGKILKEDVLIQSLLVDQLTDPVLFTDAIKNLEEEQLDYLIEVGPGNILSSLLTQQVKIPVISMQSESNSLKSILAVMGVSFVKNSETDISTLFNRHFKSFDLETEKQFFTNPCEDIETLPVHINSDMYINVQETAASVDEIDKIEGNCKLFNTLERLKTILSERLELPKKLILDESRLLDDLHLNSITVGQIVAQLSNEIGLTTRLMMTEFANASVKEIADVLDSSKNDNSDSVNTYLESIDNWVGIYGIDYINQINSTRNQTNNNDENNSYLKLMIPSNYLKENNYSNLEKIKGVGLIFVLPSKPEKTQLEHLLYSGKIAEKEKIPFILIQHPDNTCSSFAKSFFLETNIDTCLITIPYSYQVSDNFVKKIQNEIETLKGFKEVIFDQEGNRNIPVLKPLTIPNKKPTLSKDDVILFTGGGKGIAAECALALAIETGSKIAIIGRSDPYKDKDLKNTLDRAELLNITYCYEKADITNKNEINKAIKNIQENLGEISGFTHAAGINNPHSINQLEIEEFNRTIDTKYFGCENVLEFLKPEQLKFFVSFSSIIGRAGLQGESHYATANEWLSNLTRNYAERTHVKSLSLEWSVWTGVGMGNKLGVLDALKHQGITPIPVDIGVKYFVSIIGDLLEGNIDEKVMVISGRMGGVPTIEYHKGDLPLLRFVEDIKLFYPENEIIIDVHLTKEKDPYLKDHVLEKNMLFPAVMSLEAMSQSLFVLTGKKTRPIFENVLFNHPIIVDSKLGETIRLSIVRIKPDKYKVNIYTKSNDYQTIHFEAICSYNYQDLSQNHMVPSAEFDIGNSISVNPQKEMYEEFLFQKGKFKRIKNYLKVSSSESQAIITKEKNNTWFDKLSPREITLEDPGSRDACIHSIQACIPHKVLIPIKVDKIVHWGNSGDNCKELVAVGKEISQNGTIHNYDLHVYNFEGEIIESWYNLTLKETGDSSFSYSAGPLLSAFIERKLRETNEIKDIRVFLDRNEITYKDTSIVERKIMKEKIIYQLSGVNIPYIKRENGSPVNPLLNVSFANSNYLTLGVGSKGIVACDVEVVNEDIDEDIWKTMLGEKYFYLAKKLKSNSDFNCSNYTKMWTVLECMKKSGITQEVSIELIKDKSNEIYFKTANAIIGTYQMNDLIISVLVERN